jgi:ABC-type anion transport system duplicated permease subunit
MRGYGSNPQVATTILPLSGLDRSVLHSDYDQEFLELPKELGEGALVDCASSMPRLTRIFIPVAVPGMMATIILCHGGISFYRPLSRPTSRCSPQGSSPPRFGITSIMTGAPFGARRRCSATRF